MCHLFTDSSIYSTTPEMYPHGSINGSAEKKRLYLIFQPAVLKQRLNSLFVKNNFLMCAGFHGVRRFVKFGLIG
ncbi:hypothetical protein C7H79_09005 [Nitrosomonas supralitoralis]|uniref:Uncharacterized protein n=1 Tax=Nitrosomonas supralitoralis TaxID=2116706 RepID=A0A2P7NV16_9PROT|nr:hypothetical protein C7H79_09005 [Nitrosomonas supralitoralis]